MFLLAVFFVSVVVVVLFLLLFFLGGGGPISTFADITKVFRGNIKAYGF